MDQGEAGHYSINNTMKTGEYEYGLLYNANAFFDLKEKWGDDIISLFFSKTKEGFEALCDALSTMAMQDELTRRMNGYEKRKIPSKAYFMLTIRPLDVPRHLEAAADAIMRGMAQETEEEEVDTGLLELQKKTAE